MRRSDRVGCIAMADWVVGVVTHIYLQAIFVKANAPDWTGLMKVHDFLHYKVGSKAKILIVPSKCKGGNKTPINARWTKLTTWGVYALYFQGYDIPKTPQSAVSSQKGTSAATNKKKKEKDKKEKEDSTPINTGTTLKARVCMSMPLFQVTKLTAAIHTNKYPSFTLKIGPICSKFVDKIGWITGLHKAMNKVHCTHFNQTKLAHYVGVSYTFHLEIEPLPPPKSASGNKNTVSTSKKRCGPNPTVDGTHRQQT
jgi:hypothetical protein